MFHNHMLGALMNGTNQTAPKILTPEKAKKAGRYNAKRARRIGWPRHWSGVCRVLNVSDGNVSAEDFGQHVAKYQVDQKLKPDGMLGTDTWRRMGASAKIALKVIPMPAWLPKAAPKRSPIKAVSAEVLNLDAPWMAIAEQERDTNWRNDDETVIVEGKSRVDEGYFEACPYLGGEAWVYEKRHKRNKDNRHWCAAFVNYCLHTTGYSHTGSGGAFSFKQTKRWRFEALSEPTRGCVMIMEDNKNGFDHVAFLDKVGDLPSDPKDDITGSDYKGFTLLGGNQGAGTVNSKRFSNWTFFAAKDKFGNKSPYLFPIKGEGEANCNVELATAGAHYCGEQWK